MTRKKARRNLRVLEQVRTGAASSLTLRQLIEAAASEYPDGVVRDAYMEFQKTRKFPVEVGDSLAGFVAVELANCFNENAPRLAQVDEAISLMEKAQNDVGDVIRGLQQLRGKIYEESKT